MNPKSRTDKVNEILSWIENLKNKCDGFTTKQDYIVFKIFAQLKNYEQTDNNWLKIRSTKLEDELIVELWNTCRDRIK